MNTILRFAFFVFLFLFLSNMFDSVCQLWLVLSSIIDRLTSFFLLLVLVLLVPPRIVSHSPEHMHMTVREGRDARFSCTAFGRPVPVIVWHVNGLSRPGTVSTSMSSFEEQEREKRSLTELVTPSHRLLSFFSSFFVFFLSFRLANTNESILILRNITRVDAGRVDCSASNTLSTVNRQFLLHVKCKLQLFFQTKRHPDICTMTSLDKPTVTIPFHVSYFRLYDSATITCRACSLPSTTIFDFFRPKQTNPISHGIKDRFDQFINQTCRQITITIVVRPSSIFLFSSSFIRLRTMMVFISIAMFS
jgi:Immunoglobulin domain